MTFPFGKRTKGRSRRHIIPPGRLNVDDGALNDPLKSPVGFGSDSPVSRSGIPYRRIRSGQRRAFPNRATGLKTATASWSSVEASRVFPGGVLVTTFVAEIKARCRSVRDC